MTDEHPGLIVSRRIAAEAAARRNGHPRIDEPFTDASSFEPEPDDIPPPPEPPPDDPVPSLLAGMFTAAQLDTMTFADLVEHVPHLITEGFGVLAGPPKAGKSWLVAGIALGCAYGGTVLGSINVDARHVLLLALEDGPRRLQTRMRKLTRDQALPHRLHILTKVTPGTVIPTIIEWLADHADDPIPPLVILDTLGKARPQRRPGDDPYIADYQLGTRIKDVVDAVPGAALLCVHHTRKMGAEDWLDTVSGSVGITGSADYILVLTRKRQSAEGVLSVTGRDIAENEYAVKTDEGIWTLDGMDILDAAATAAKRRTSGDLGDRSLDALAFVSSRPLGTRPADLAKHLRIDSNVAGNYLRRLHDAGRIAKRTRGIYTPLVEVVEVVETDERPGHHDQPEHDQNTTSTTSTTDLFDEE